MDIGYSNTLANQTQNKDQYKAQNDQQTTNQGQQQPQLLSPMNQRSKIDFTANFLSGGMAQPSVPILQLPSDQSQTLLPNLSNLPGLPQLPIDMSLPQLPVDMSLPNLPNYLPNDVINLPNLPDLPILPPPISQVSTNMINPASFGMQAPPFISGGQPIQTPLTSMPPQYNPVAIPTSNNDSYIPN